MLKDGQPEVIPHMLETTRTSAVLIMAMSVFLLWNQGALTGQEGTRPGIESPPPAGSTSASTSPSAAPLLTTAADEPLTPAVIERLSRQAADLTDLDAATKKSIADFYQQAMDSWKQAEARQVRQKEFDRLVGTAETLLKETQAKLAKLPKEITLPPAAANADLEALTSDIATLKARIEHPETGLTKRLADLNGEAARRSTRLKEIPTLITTAQARLEELTKQQEQAPAEGEASALTQARRIAIYAQRMAILREIGALRQEQSWYELPASSALAREQRDLAARELSLSQQEVEQLQTILARRRQQDAEMRVKQAQREAALAHPILKPLAEVNEKLAQQDQQLAQKTQRAVRDLAEIRQQTQRLKDDFRRVQEMVNTVGLTESIGLLLRKKRSSLPDLGAISERLAADADVFRELQLKLFEIDDELTTLRSPELVLGQVLASLKLTSNDLPKEILEAQAEILLKQKRDLLTTLDRSYTTAFENQVALDAARRELVEQVQQFRSYIDERVLWIRTSGPISLETFHDARAAVKWLFSVEDWQQASQVLMKDLWQSFPLYLLAALGLFPLLLLRRRMGVEIRLLGEQSILPSCRTFTPTMRALTWTVLLAIGWPAFVGFMAWRLADSASSSLTTEEIARCLKVSAIFLLTLELLRMITLKKGLASHHFGWSESFVRRLYRGMTTLAVCGTPLVFAITFLSVHQQSDTTDEKYLDALGRPLFLLLLVMISGVSWATMFRQAPGTHLLTGEPVESPLIQRVQTLAKYLAVVIPLLLGVLVAMGYFYTAGQLAIRLHWTFWLIVGLIILQAIVMRWITIERRKLALEQVKQMRQAAEESVRQVPGSLATNLQSLLFSSFKVDLAAIVNQVRSLLRTSLVIAGLCGVWFIWADIIPALGILDRLELWETTQTVASSAASPSASSAAPEGTAGKPANNTSSSSVSGYRKVTARDLAVAILIFAAALIAGQNIPGLLEVALLRRLSSDRGLHLTVITLVRYLIFTLGVILAFGQIGVSWSNVQWLVAAASLGLGFGLQEIFANFVSGIIILLERPIREGDVVTVGDVSGTVSKIRFRATTITDWDRKELLVPNKEFITSRVLNWTLSDKVNRLTIKVGVAYGSDPFKVQEVLMKCVTSIPQVLQNPGPSVVFDEFGDNAMRFTIRFFLPDLENRLAVTHQLHIAIYRELAAAGIEISFPQMDLHVRSIPEDWKIAAAKVAHEVEANPANPSQPQATLPLDLGNADG
ncbi:mechanosensitive ion channel domain-containing protein [Planctopirus hydrillae]|uniref:Mechanosensitive ion channel inner membrane domain-containing protein n=1 Tax=Planctopirus hydrillae TaxID=1841610 RepID=A0A1C3EME7_9PLAN|nr:mechanosensitive ion channel domain-containing protein [Planctopirus hydrillae]ODA34417.1 hypothetical protein A6X21_17295 [Planctopirus hydrillae]